MAEWIVEQGIGEERAFRLSYDGIEELRLRWTDAGLQAGEIDDAILLEQPAQGGRARVRFPSGQEALGRNIPRSASVGSPVRMEVTREPVAERGRLKLAQARHSTSDLAGAPSLADQLVREGHEVELTTIPWAQADWDALWLDAASRDVDFEGGKLLLAETPAMTLIDVDTTNPDPSAATRAIARTLRRFDLGGNIGIDYPTLSSKSDRKLVDEQLGMFLEDWPHERTAMNGFGFVQIIRRLQRPSLLHRIARNRKEAAARLLLRRAELLEGAGMIALYAQAPVLDYLSEDWLDQLRRRTGRQIALRPDAGIAFDAPHAQMVPHE